MKKIKYTFLSLFVAAGLFTSCSDDDSDGVDINATDVNATVSVFEAGAAEGAPLSFTVTLDQAFASDATVRVRAELDDNRFITGDVTIPAGSSSAQGKVFIPAGDPFDSGLFSGFVDYVSVKAEGVVLSEPVAGEAYNLVSNEVLLNLYDSYQFPYGADVINSRGTLLLDWENPVGNDLDQYIPGFESSETGDRYEFDIFNAEYPDGDYPVEVGFWITADSEISWRFYFVHPNQTTVDLHEGTFSGLAIGNGVNANQVIVTITKSTDMDGVVTFSTAAN